LALSDPKVCLLSNQSCILVVVLFQQEAMV
jgi:hypothetical protein